MHIDVYCSISIANALEILQSSVALGRRYVLQIDWKSRISPSKFKSQQLLKINVCNDTDQACTDCIAFRL